MSSDRHLDWFTRQLRQTSQKEELPAEAEVTRRAVACAKEALISCYREVGYQVNSVVGEPSKHSRQPSYRRTRIDGVRAKSTRELIRKIIVRGQFGPYEDRTFDSGLSGPQTALPAPTDRREFVCICWAYLHPDDFRWQMGHTTFTTSDDSWREPTSRKFICRNRVEKKEYMCELQPLPVTIR